MNFMRKGAKTRVLFVHGMGRTPLSGWILLKQLKRGGYSTQTFAYSVRSENYLSIRDRLVAVIQKLAATEDYVLIGHSLGGVLIRGALNALPEATPRPGHLFLLGSPIQASQIAQLLCNNRIYQRLTGDCGQLIASDRQMSNIGSVSIPTTSIVGARGFPVAFGPFCGEANDWVVSISEVSADWIRDQVVTSSIHTLLPASNRIAEVVLDRLRQGTKSRSQNIQVN